MDNIEQHIIRFASLPEAEQEEVEAYVDDHPKWRALLADVKAIEAMRREVPALLDVDEEMLAYYVVVQQSALGASPALRRHFEDVEDRLASDARLRARYEALAERLQAFADELDPTAQFERLTGFRVPASSRSADPPVQRSADSASGDKEESARIGWLPRAVQWAAAAVVLMALLYGALFGISRTMQSDIERLALVDISETQIEGYQLTTRGTATAAGESQSTDALYLQALRTLRGARTSTLGLFPRYDQEQLGQAEQLLHQVIEREEAQSFLQLEAYFFLGKVHLAQGNIEAARSSFRTVAVSEGRRAHEAVEILTVLQETHPAHG